MPQVPNLRVPTACKFLIFDPEQNPNSVPVKIERTIYKSRFAFTEADINLILALCGFRLL